MFRSALRNARNALQPLATGARASAACIERRALATLCAQAYGAGNRPLVGAWLQLGLALSVCACVPVGATYFFAGDIMNALVGGAYAHVSGWRFKQASLFSVTPKKSNWSSTAWHLAVFAASMASHASPAGSASSQNPRNTVTSCPSTTMHSHKFAMGTKNGRTQAK